MTKSAIEIETLADLLPDELSCTDSRMRLLCLGELLRCATDEEHPLSNSQIREVLEARFGAKGAAAENTVNADLRALRECGLPDLEVHTTSAGTWAQNPRLTPQKVRLLLNAVQSSRFLTMQQSAELQEDLINLVSRHQEDALLGEVHVEQRVRKSYQQVFDTCDLIARALREGRKIEFEYTFNDFDGKPQKLAGDDGSFTRVETPIALLFSDSNYYLESYSETPWRHNSLLRSRVDRMYNVRVSGEPALDNAEVRRARKTADKRMVEGFEMVEGPSRVVFLKVRADMTNVMIDKFGYGLKYAQFSGALGEVETTAMTCVRVAQSFTFFRWLTSAGDRIVIERPRDEMWVSTGPWKRVVRDATYEELVADYEAMRDGYLAYLDAARQAYL